MQCRWYCLIAILLLLTSVFGQQHEGVSDFDRVLWTDPGDVGARDFRYGVGGSELQPQPPFRFVDEDMSGTSPKVDVTDIAGRHWNVKWGSEAQPSTFCTRLIWACGYYAEPEYFIPSGRIIGAKNLNRASKRLRRDGSFVDARFQLRTDSPKYLKDVVWKWDENPFVGTHELQGLKILMLLVSNWDPKTSNLRVFEDKSAGNFRYLYAAVDWGASMGKWGGRFKREKWDCEGFEKQTPDFIKSVENERIKWGYRGKKREDVTDDITIDDVRWLLQYLGRITDAQIRDGLEASGATPQENECYARSLRQRIQQLEAAAGAAVARDHASHP